MLHFEPSGSSLRFLPLLLALSGGEGREGSRMKGRTARRAVQGWEGEQGRNSQLPSLPKPHCPSRRPCPAKDGMSEEHINVPRKSRASGAGAAKSQGKDRALRPSSSAGKPSWKGETPFSLPAPRFSPSTGSDEDPQTPNHSHNFGESSTSMLARARQAQNQTDPSPSSLTPVSNLP